MRATGGRWRDTAARRAGLGLIGALLLVAASASPAPAKLPPFTMDIWPEVVEVGASVQVTVTMLDPSDPGRRDPSFEAEDMTGLVGVLPAEFVDDNGRPVQGAPRARPVVLPSAGRGFYRGTVITDRLGSFVFLPFPHVHMTLPGDPAGAYPQPVTVTVVPPDAGADVHSCGARPR